MKVQISMYTGLKDVSNLVGYDRKKGEYFSKVPSEVKLEDCWAPLSCNAEWFEACQPGSIGWLRKDAVYECESNLFDIQTKTGVFGVAWLNEWLDSLQDYAKYAKEEGKLKEVPFKELLPFRPFEGIIGPRTGRKLGADFATHFAGYSKWTEGKWKPEWIRKEFTGMYTVFSNICTAISAVGKEGVAVFIVVE